MERKRDSLSPGVGNNLCLSRGERPANTWSIGQSAPKGPIIRRMLESSNSGQSNPRCSVPALALIKTSLKKDKLIPNNCEN